MNQSVPDAELFGRIREQLHTAVIGDILDKAGRRHQFLPPEIRAQTSDRKLVGRAMPVLISDTFAPAGRPFGKLTEALDELRPGEIYIARNGRTPVAAWGEILTHTAIRNGATGAVLDGYHRDTNKILPLDFPVFSRGPFGQDAGVRTIVVDYRVPIEIGQAWIMPGDLIVGDSDGVVVVPQDAEHEVLEGAFSKVATENEVLSAIQHGMSATEAFDTFGVL